MPHHDGSTAPAGAVRILLLRDCDPAPMMPDGEARPDRCRTWRTFPTHALAERWVRLMRSEEWMHVVLCDDCYKWHAIPNDRTLPHA